MNSMDNKKKYVYLQSLPQLGVPLLYVCSKIDRVWLIMIEGKA